MSLLDELKAKADEHRTDTEIEAARLADQAAHYQTQLLPRMVQAYSYLKELTEHLSVVDETCPADYPLLPAGKPITLQQGDYSVAIDSRQRPTQLELRCGATLAESIYYDIKGKKQVEQQQKLLNGYGLKYECTERKDDRFEIESAGFKLIGPLPIRVVLLADSEERCLTLHLRNIDRAGITSVNLAPSKFDGDFLDRLGRFILRQQSNLFSIELSKEARKKLHDKLSEQRAEEERARRVLEAKREALAKAEHDSRTTVKLSRAVKSAARKL
jgi:hypothetical protein